MSDVDRLQASEPVRLPAVPRRRWWWPVVLSLVIFGSGAIAGGGATALLLRHYAQENIIYPEKARERLLAWMRWKLDLTEPQAEQVAELLRSRQAEVMKIRRQVQPQVEAQLDRLEADVAAVLTAEQQEEWHGMVARLRKQWIPPLPSGERGQRSEHP